MPMDYSVIFNLLFLALRYAGRRKKRLHSKSWYISPGYSKKALVAFFISIGNRRLPVGFIRVKKCIYRIEFIRWEKKSIDNGKYSDKVEFILGKKTRIQKQNMILFFHGCHKVFEYLFCNFSIHHCSNLRRKVFFFSSRGENRRVEFQMLSTKVFTRYLTAEYRDINFYHFFLLRTSRWQPRLDYYPVLSLGSLTEFQ